MTAVKGFAPESKDGELRAFRSWFHAYDVGREEGFLKGELLLARKVVALQAPELLAEVEDYRDPDAVLRRLMEHLRGR